MAEILLLAGRFPSSRYPSVELGRRLVAAGHRVSWAGDPNADGLAAHHGLRPVALSDAADVGAIEARLSEAPDLVLVDGEQHEAILVAAASGHRVALLNHFAAIWRCPGLPPPHALVRPGVGWRGSRVGIRALWWALRARKAWRRRGRGAARERRLRALARERDFDLEAAIDRGQWSIPFTWRDLPVLSLHAFELELPHTPPARVTWVGPMMLQDRRDRSLPVADRQRLDAIFARRRADGERRLLFAAFGTSFSVDSELVQRLAAAVAGRPGWELIVSAPGFSPPAGAPSTEVFEWLPQLEVLAEADLVISHAGINTIDEAILHGLPLLIYCGFETDMGGNAARVLHHGLGRVGDPKRDREPEILAHIDRLLQEAGYWDQVESFRRSFRRYEVERVAEVAVERLLERESGP